MFECSWGKFVEHFLNFRQLNFKNKEGSQSSLWREKLQVKNSSLRTIFSLGKT
jgi:hypothetical protein